MTEERLSTGSTGLLNEEQKVWFKTQLRPLVEGQLAELKLAKSIDDRLCRMEKGQQLIDSAIERLTRLLEKVDSHEDTVTEDEIRTELNSIRAVLLEGDRFMLENNVMP